METKVVSEVGSREQAMNAIWMLTPMGMKPSRVKKTSGDTRRHLIQPRHSLVQEKKIMTRASVEKSVKGMWSCVMVKVGVRRQVLY